MAIEPDLTPIVKLLRRDVDKVIKEVRKVHAPETYNPAGREFALAITKLQEAKMWLGEALGAMGNKLPEEFRDEA
jgi:hypothetical protein